METVCGKTGRIFTVDAHAERETFRIIVKGIRPILGFPTFVFYNAVLPFPVAEGLETRLEIQSDRREP